MTMKITKDSIDLGIVTTDAEKMIAFYRDSLGLKPNGEVPMPGGGKMHRFLCGTSVLKIVVNGKAPAAKSPPGGIGGATGFRYFTITVSNIDEILAKCGADGHKIVVAKMEFMPGFFIAIVADPDGNWVEFLQVG